MLKRLIMGEQKMLSGIRILDFSAYLPGPYATQRLADLGAEVIKIEPLHGEPARDFGVQYEGNGLIFLANNRNKKSIAINLKNQLGRQIALDLIAKSDVLVESFRPGVMKKLGLDYETLKSLNSKLIYCSITGFGQDTTFRLLGSHDLNYMAMSGVLAQLKDQNGKPVQPTTTLADFVGGQTASEAILAALLKRERIGEGSYLDLALADSITSMMTNHVLISQMTGEKYGVPELSGNLVCYSLYETGDGKYVSLAALEPKFWRNFCEAVGRDEWIPYHNLKTDEQSIVYQEIKNLFLSKTRKEWQQFGLAVDCCLAPVLEADELINHAYFNERRQITKTKWGHHQVKTTSSTNIDETVPPIVSEQAEEILQDLLHYSPPQIETFFEKGVVKKGENVDKPVS